MRVAIFDRPTHPARRRADFFVHVTTPANDDVSEVLMMSDDPTRREDDDQAQAEPGRRCETIELADGGQLRYWKHFFRPRFADHLYPWLQEVVPWEQMKFRGRPEPRLTAWMADFPYRYSGIVRKPAPMRELVRRLVVMVEREVFENGGGHFDGVLLNYYRNGLDKIGLHTDAEPDLQLGAPIASLSLGATRRFILRHNRTREKIELSLGHGSLLVMEGTTQTFWKHEVPAEPRCTQGRINLTMRCHTLEVAR